MCPALDMRLMIGQVVRFLLISELIKMSHINSHSTERLYPSSNYSFDYDIQSGLLNIDFELEWIDSEKGGFHNCHSRLRMLWIEHGCYWLDFDVVTVAKVLVYMMLFWTRLSASHELSYVRALVAVSLVSMNSN